MENDGHKNWVLLPEKNKHEKIQIVTKREKEGKEIMKKLKESYYGRISPNSDASKEPLLWTGREKNTNYDDIPNPSALSV